MRYFRRLASAVLAVVVALSFLAPDLSAQDRDPDALFTMALRGVPLGAALQQFQQLTRLDISWDPLLIQNKRVFCVTEDQPVESVLSCLLVGTGLDFVRRSNGLYVLEIASEGDALIGNLRGIVLDAATEQPLSYAHIIIAEAGRASSANTEGLFIFPKLIAGEYSVRVSHLGFRTRFTTVTIEAGGNESIEVILETHAPYMISTPIIVNGIGMTPSSTLLGAPSASQKEVTDNISTGTSGLLQSLDALPGVRVNDATADVHIQGGEAGEHQFRLDGAPVFLPLNVASFIGPFSPFALGKITVHKAGYSAALGSQISGIIAAEHDLRAPSRIQAGRSNSQITVQVDPLSSNVRHTGFWLNPSGKRITTLSALRVGTWSLLAPPSLSGLLDDWNAVDSFLLSAFADDNTPFSNLPPTGDPSIQFVDAHTAFKVQMGLRTLTASSYWGRSSIGNNLSRRELNGDGTQASDFRRLKDVYSWQNGMSQVRLTSVRSAKVISTFGARGSFYRLNHDFDEPGASSRVQSEDDGNRVFETALDVGIDYFPGNNHVFELGSEIILTGSRFTVAGTQQFPLFHDSRGWRLTSFVQDKIQVGKNAVFEAGSRFTWLASRNTLYAEPRASARFDWLNTPVGGVSLYVGTGVYRQFVSQFDISSRSPRTFVSSTRFWMGNDESVTPPKAAHFAAEFLMLPSPNWAFTLESFYKHQFHVLSVDYSAATDASQDLRQSDFLQASRGFSYGLSAGVKRTVGPGSLKARLDHTITRRRIDNLFRTDLLSVPWSEPFRLELSADIVPIKRTVMLARWRSSWGRTWGFRKSYYDFLSAHLNDVDALLEEMRENGVAPDAIRRIERQISSFDLSNPDSHRLNAIHQLDLSAAHSLRLGKYAMQLRLDVINVLDRDNTAEWRFELDEESYFGSPTESPTGLLERSNRSLLPRVVSFAARLTW